MILNDPKRLSNLVCKVNCMHTYMTMHQRNVYHSNKTVSLSWHKCVLHHIVYKLNTCISWTAKKLNTLSTNHIRNICYSSTNELVSCLNKMTCIKFKSMPSMHIHISTTTRPKTLFSFVVCNRKPYDVILFFHVLMLELLIRGVLFGDVINIIFMQI